MSKIEDKKMNLSYKFKEGDTLNYELNKTITEKIISDKNISLHSQKTFTFNIEQKIAHIDDTGLATIIIKNNESIKKITRNNKGNMETQGISYIFSLPEEEVKINSKWTKKQVLCLPWLSVPLEYNITYLLSEYRYIKEYNCARIEVLPEEIHCPLILEDNFACNQITSFDGEFYFAPEEGLLVKSVQRTNIIARIETILLDSNLEIVMELKK
ncbi:MAG: hypothetical protein ABRQ39_30300 [Candidatus Eremiobacterota bacterium]